MTRARPALAEMIAVATLTIAALAVRSWGIGYLLPHSFEWDSPILGQRFELATDGARSMPLRDRAAHPTLIAHLASIGLVLGDDPIDGERRTLAEHVARCATPALHARTWIACLSAGIVPLTWLLHGAGARGQEAPE